MTFELYLIMCVLRLKHIATGHYLAAYPKEKERKSPVVPRKSEGGDLQLNVPRMIRRRLGLGYANFSQSFLCSLPLPCSGSASEDEDEEPIECTFTTVKEFSNSATLFTVHPLGTTVVRICSLSSLCIAVKTERSSASIFLHRTLTSVSSSSLTFVSGMLIRSASFTRAKRARTIRE